MRNYFLDKFGKGVAKIKFVLAKLSKKTSILKKKKTSKSIETCNKKIIKTYQQNIIKHPFI